MTLKPEPTPIEEPKSDPVEISILEDIFYLGYTTSKKITIFNDEEKKIKVNVVFRTLMPVEFRDIFETVGKYDTYQAQEIVNIIETLARSIQTINDMPLALDQKDKEDYEKLNKKAPTPLDQAREILTNKIKSAQVLDALFEEYNKFYDGVKEQFKDIKKK